MCAPVFCSLVYFCFLAYVIWFCCSWCCSFLFASSGCVVTIISVRFPVFDCIKMKKKKLVTLAVKLRYESISLSLISTHLFLNRGSLGHHRWFRNHCPPFSLFSTALLVLANSRPAHSLVLSSHLFLCLSCLLSPFTVPCKTALARPDERETWPYYCSFGLFTMVRRSSCGPIACWIFARTSSLVFFVGLPRWSSSLCHAQLHIVKSAN